MKKLLPLLTVLFLLLTVTPTFAKSGSSENGKANSESGQDSEFKNHGQFVSSVAATDVGAEEVSEAAKSDIGKKEHDGDKDDDEDNDDNVASPTPSVSPNPSVSPIPSVSPTPSVSPSPEVSASPSASPSPSVSPIPTTQEQITFLQGLVDRLNSIIETLKNLL